MIFSPPPKTRTSFAVLLAKGNQWLNLAKALKEVARDRDAIYARRIKRHARDGSERVERRTPLVGHGLGSGPVAVLARHRCVVHLASRVELEAVEGIVWWE